MWPFQKRVKRGDRGGNRWTGGTVDLIFPPIEATDIGARGARFVDLEFQADVGPEIFLGILEEGIWAQQYGCVKELDLFATTLAVQSDAGPVAMVIWRLAQRAKTLVHYEHFLDPLHEPTRRLLRRLETQSRFKVVMRDNQTGDTAGFWEFDNNFCMGEFAEFLSKVTATRGMGPFAQRVALFQRDYTLEDLIAAAEGG